MELRAQVSEAAQHFLLNLLSKQNVQGMAARLFVSKGGTSHAETCLSYCAPGKEKSTDHAITLGDLTLYFDQPSLPYLQDIDIDLEPHELGDRLTITAPHAKKPASTDQHLKLTASCHALTVPAGEPAQLPAGAELDITQALGGSFTVSYQGNLYRLSAETAASLGLAPEILVFETPEDGLISEDQCWLALGQVYDPEIPVNIVSLGLVYELRVNQHTAAVVVDMTLTAPGCGMGPVIVEDVRARVLQVPLVQECHVNLVFDPPWTYDRMSEEARLETGLY